MNNYYNNNMGTMNTQGGYGYTNNYVPGTSYPNQMASAKMTQPLTKQEIAELRNNSGAFTLQISDKDMRAAICTHKLDNGFTLNDNPDGSTTCSICGHTFTLVQGTQEEIKSAVQTVVDIIQTIKTLYLDIPENVAREFFPIIPLLEKIPKLYEIACNNFNRHENPQMPNGNYNQYGFNMLSSLTGGVPQQMNYYGQPAYGQPQMQPQMDYNQMNYGQPQMQPQGNPFYGQPQMQQPVNYGQPQMQMQQPVNYGQPQMQPQGQPGYINQAPQGQPGYVNQAPQGTNQAPQGQQPNNNKPQNDGKAVSRKSFDV